MRLLNWRQPQLRLYKLCLVHECRFLQFPPHVTWLGVQNGELSISSVIRTDIDISIYISRVARNYFITFIRFCLFVATKEYINVQKRLRMTLVHDVEWLIFLLRCEVKKKSSSTLFRVQARGLRPVRIIEIDEFVTPSFISHSCAKPSTHVVERRAL